MRRLLTAAATAALALTGLAAPARATTDPRQVTLTLTRAWTGLAEPVAIAHPPGDSRVFIVERAGRIRVVRNGVLKATPFLDIRSKVSTNGEGGLLGLAFRPDYKSSGRFFVYWTDASGYIRIQRYRAAPTSDVAYATGVDILKIAHPSYSNHYGGQLAFGSGGYLFAGTGDGGGAGDPKGNAQNPYSLLGKILRIDVTHYPSGAGYAIPSGNPYASGGGRKEVWALGLRNPWRFSFDRSSPANLWVGDVGQGDREEVDVFSTGGRNLGWDCREGTLNTAATYGGSYCKSSGYLAPVTQYDHILGCAIIGGYVYRGTKYASLLGGTYLFADYCSGRIWGLGRDASGNRVRAQVGSYAGQVVAFGEVAGGELLLVSASGTIYRIGAAHR
jgi:glucose/arabinose dehydrogenase